MNPNQGPDVMEQIPNGPNVMEPSSGTYGAVEETNRIKQQLNVPEGPSGPGGGGPEPTPGPPPGMPMGMPSQAQPPSGVPAGIMAPSTQPDVPVSTPLGGPVSSPAMNASAAQQRLQVLDQLSQNPNVSEETREWASDIVKKLASRSR